MFLGLYLAGHGCHSQRHKWQKCPGFSRGRNTTCSARGRVDNGGWGLSLAEALREYAQRTHRFVPILLILILPPSGMDPRGAHLVRQGLVWTSGLLADAHGPNVF